MNYSFECKNEKCAKKQIPVIIPMKISEYTSEQYCEICGEKLERTIESLVCGYKCNCGGFYGKTSD